MYQVLLFEVRYRLRQASTYLFFVLLFGCTFSIFSSDLVKSVGAENMKYNAPLALAVITSVLTGLGAVMVAALAGTSIYRDYECGAHELFFTSGLRKRDYFYGRYFGSLIVTLGVFSGMLWGILVGTKMPWIDAGKLLPFRPIVFLEIYFLYILPNLVLLSALFFTIGALTRSLIAIYTQSVLLLVGYVMALNWISDLHNRAVGSLFDPLGMMSTSVVTEYWSVYERNHNLIPLQGPVLWNRLIWGGIALGVLLIGYRLFEFSARPRSLWRARRGRAGGERYASSSTVQKMRDSARDRGAIEGAAQDVPLTSTAYTRWGAQFIRLTRSYLRDMMRSTPFMVIVFAGVLLLVSVTYTADKIYGTSIYPVTRMIVESVSTSFLLFLLILLTFYAGELTWKERVVKLDQIHDALPISSALMLVSKIAALLTMQALLLLGLIGTGMVIQAAKGYFHFQPGLYLSYLYGTVFWELFVLTLLAFCIHAVVNHKFLGHTLVIVFYAAIIAASVLGWQDKLYLYSDLPSVTLSDMNGYGPYAAPRFWFTLYWSLCAVLLGIVAMLASVRGTGTGRRHRRAVAASRWTPPVRWLTLATAAAFVVTGGFIFTNTHVLNPYRSERTKQQLQAEYEKRYKRYADAPLPRITDVKVQVDLYPSEPRYRVAGTYQVCNTTDAPIEELPLTIDGDLTVRALECDRPITRTVSDRPHDFYVYRLSRPLMPGETMPLRFDLVYERRRFPNDDSNTDIVANGSFLTGEAPMFGYQETAELIDDDDRKRYGLSPRIGLASPDDLEARRNTYLGKDADWITFDATLSTTADQIAIAPGYLEREWVAGGRRYFHYVMDAKIRNFYTFLSARYAVRRDHWIGPDGKEVAIEIDYHPDHTYNLDRMVRGVQRALDYYTSNFGPYQYRQLRIAEFPCYRSLAQSFPNTIPYSEGIGFIARVQSADDIDYPFYVTAHEVAHQWWAHQVIGANVQGSEMLSESLAEYSALMVMQKEYGPENMRRFLRYDLDQYLEGRGSDGAPERPLMLVENQPYIQYDKGALALYALQDYIGESTLNRALARFIRDKGFQMPPYTTAKELVEQYLRPATPASLQYLITDLFEKITFYDNKVKSAVYTRVAPDKYHVRLTVEAGKFYSDSKGPGNWETLNDAIDIGIFAAAAPGHDFGKPLVLEKRTLTQSETTLEYDVCEKPAIAGIDPYNKLIDRDPNDNTMAIEPQ
jgi:hypothetical protein